MGSSIVKVCLWIGFIGMGANHIGTSQPIGERGAVIQGKVYNSFGIAENTAIVGLYSDGTLIKEVNVDEGANYKFDGLSAGRFICKVKALKRIGNSIHLSRDVELKSSQRLIVDIVILRQENDENPFKTEVSGNITFVSGMSAQSARVVLIDPFNQHLVSETLTDEKGGYKLVAPAKGQYILQAFYPGYMVETKAIIVSGDPLRTNMLLTAVNLR